MKLNAGRIIGAGIVFAVISQIIHSIEAFATMNYYLIPEYWPVWSKVMMPGEGAPPMSFYGYSFGFAVIIGVIFALAYSVIKDSLKGKNAMQNGVRYGTILFFVAGIPFSLTLYLLVNLPVGLIAYWAFSTLIIYVLGAIAIAKIVK